MSKFTAFCLNPFFIRAFSTRQIHSVLYRPVNVLIPSSSGHSQQAVHIWQDTYLVVLIPSSSGHSQQVPHGSTPKPRSRLNPFFIRAFSTSHHLEEEPMLDFVLIPSSSGHSQQAIQGHSSPRGPRLNPFFIRAFSTRLLEQKNIVVLGLNPFFIRAFSTRSADC